MSIIRQYTVVLLIFSLFSTMAPDSLISTAEAVENDQYVAWGADIDDSVDVLNEYINRHIRIVVGSANRSIFRYSCGALTFRIGWHFSRQGIKKTDLWAEKNPMIQKYPDNREDLGKEGVYRNIKKLRHAGRTINVNGVHIGVDKLSHTMAMGFVYWMKYRYALLKLNRIYRDKPEVAERRALEEAIKIGIWSEKTYTGLNKYASGMFSYGDMESNYQGLLIYKSLCEGKDRRLKMYGRKRWKFVGRPVDFRDHVNPYWNEIFNPNYHARRIWPVVGPLLKEYCAKRQDPAKVAEYERYKKWAAEITPSFSQVYLAEKLEQGKIPDPRPQRLDRICPEEGKTPVVVKDDLVKDKDLVDVEKVTSEEAEASVLKFGDEDKKERIGFAEKDSYSPEEFYIVENEKEEE